MSQSLARIYSSIFGKCSLGLNALTGAFGFQPNCFVVGDLG